jgi:hypothetical protein
MLLTAHCHHLLARGLSAVPIDGSNSGAQPDELAARHSPSLHPSAGGCQSPSHEGPYWSGSLKPMTCVEPELRKSYEGGLPSPHSIGTKRFCAFAVSCGPSAAASTCVSVPQLHQKSRAPVSTAVRRQAGQVANTAEATPHWSGQTSSTCNPQGWPIISKSTQQFD